MTTITIISPLRQHMIEDTVARNMAPAYRRGHLRRVVGPAASQFVGGDAAGKPFRVPCDLHRSGPLALETRCGTQFAGSMKPWK